MNASLRDLKHRAEAVAPPSFDVEHIVERGDARLRRRRAALAAGAAGLVIAVIGAGAALTGSNQGSTDPVESPSPSVTETPAETSTRQLTYADVAQGQPPRWPIRSIRYGDRTLRLDMPVMHIDVTDDGLALVAEDGTIYFADGSSVQRIGELTIDVSWSDGGVISASAGSWLAWFTPAEPEASLVVHDAQERTTVTRVPVPGCGPRGCRLEAIIGDRVHWSEGDESERPQGAGRPMRVLDVTSGIVSETNQGALWDELRGNPRALVKGDSFARRRGRQRAGEPGGGLLRGGRLFADAAQVRG